MANKKQESLFNNKDSRASKDIDDVSVFDMNEEKRWEKEWEGMPEFEQDDKTSFRHVIVHFENNDDVAEFFSIIGQSHTDQTKSIWFPEQENMDTEAKRYG